MATPIEMPKLGNTVEECLLARWIKHAGDRVGAGELIAEIETDKATFELMAPADGTLLATFASEGELVPVFTNVCVIGEPGEDIEQFRPRQAAEAPQAAPASAQTDPERAAAPARQALATSPGVMSPRARRFANEHGFRPEGVVGSGPGGRVLEADLKSLYRAAPRASSLARQYIESGYEVRREGSGVHGMLRARDLDEPAERVSGIREKIARRMREALAASAQYTLNSSADAAGLLALRSRVKQARQRGDVPDININEMVMFCAVRALQKMPELNVAFSDGRVQRYSSVHLGFACDTPRGLLVPVVRDAQKLSLADLSLRVKELTRQAVDGHISPDDLTGATFTVSNLGNLGIESFTPVLVPPQVALLGVNTIEVRPVRRDGKIEFVDRIGLSLTCDHQWIDGAPGARFLAAVREEIENIEAVECTI